MKTQSEKNVMTFIKQMLKYMAPALLKELQKYINKLLKTKDVSIPKINKK